jgi:hypothetical protein
MRELVSAFEMAIRGAAMRNPVSLSLWFGMALYAAIGLLGVAVFHEIATFGQQPADGYGIGYSALAVAAEPAK